MATVNLESAWLNVASDPADSLSLPTMSSLSVKTEKVGEVRRMANGRTRTVTRGGVAQRRVTVAVAYATRAEIDWIEDHVGVLLCARDNQGRKVFGIYHEVEVDEYQAIEDGRFTLSLSEVTFSEVV